MANFYNCFHAKVNSLKKRLTRLSGIGQCDCPELNEVIPSPDGIDIEKLGHHARLIMTDFCNAAQKARRLLQHKIGGNILELDCYHHLRNVWINSMEQSVSSFVRVVISYSLEKIPPKLQVTCVYSAIARA
jgi:hypothetical protein